MKNPITFAIAFFLIFLNSFGQSSESKLKFRSISTGFGIFSGEINSGGINAYIDIATAIRKNIFTVAYSTGSELDFFDKSREYYEVGLLYGRELHLSRIIKLETHIGLAHFEVRYKNSDNDFVLRSESALAVPIKVKWLCYLSRKVALGLKPNITFNTAENIYSAHVIIQYKF